MNKISLSDLIFGIAEFSASEGFADEFISRCAEEKILIYNLKHQRESVTGSVHHTELKKLTYAANKSGMHLDILKRRGLPYIFYRYRRRFGIPAGLLVFILITAVLHSVVWSIDISPTEIIPREDIISALDEAGVKTGVFIEAVDVRDTERLLYEKFENISWVNVKIIGTRLNVDISEVKIKENYKEQKYTNIVAAKDGEIIEAGIFRGEGKIDPGTAVVKGDLLISGIINHRDGSVEFVDSEGHILARTKNFIASAIPFTVTVKHIANCKDICLPVFFGIAFTDLINVRQDYFTEASCFIDGGDVVIPVGITRKFAYELETAELELTDNEAALLCFRDFSFLCLRLYKNTEIIESDIKLSYRNGAEFSGSFLVVEDIALKKEFTVEESNPSR